jgi:hypothetical protein
MSCHGIGWLVVNNSGLYTNVAHTSDVIKNTLDPVWQPFNVPVGPLNGGVVSATIKVSCWDWDKSVSTLHKNSNSHRPSYLGLTAISAMLTGVIMITFN